MDISKQLVVDDITIELTRKRVKNVNLRVAAPHGIVHVSAPKRVPERFIRDFVRSKMEWIRNLQHDIQTQSQTPVAQFQTGETYAFWGKAYPLRRVVSNTVRVALVDEEIVLAVPLSASATQCAKTLDEWQRVHIKHAIPTLIKKWEPIIGVKSRDWGVKKMKTKWGTCNIQDARIWLNLELSKYPPECLEYVLVHELVHLHERYHNARFYAYMDQFLPQWQALKDRLNQPPC